MRLPYSTAALAGLALFLAGCTTTQDRVARAQADMAKMITIYGPACVQLGYADKTDQWRQCVLQLSTREEMERASASASYYSGWGPGYWRGRGYWGPYW